jgi:hypothetical protein
MAQGVNSTKTGSRPSHEAIEQNAEATEVGMSERRKMDKAAMETAKRANNRTVANEDSTPGNSMFTK